MKNILCKIFGHKPPVYAKRGWYSPGEEYAKSIIPSGIDATGREHAIIGCSCARCNENFDICRVHLPKRNREEKLEKELKRVLGSELLPPYLR